MGLIFSVETKGNVRSPGRSVLLIQFRPVEYNNEYGYTCPNTAICKLHVLVNDLVSIPHFRTKSGYCVLTLLLNVVLSVSIISAYFNLDLTCVVYNSSNRQTFLIQCASLHISLSRVHILLTWQFSAGLGTCTGRM